MPLQPTSSNIQKGMRVPTVIVKRPLPKVHPSTKKKNKNKNKKKDDAPQTAALDPPREPPTAEPETAKSFITACCGCESFPTLPGLIELTITLWPVEFEQLDPSLDLKVEVYIYGVDPELEAPDLAHGKTVASDLPPLERVASFDTDRETEFFDDVEEALMDLLEEMRDEWSDDPLEFRDAFIEKMQEIGWGGRI
ncbi:hypothetical protein BJY00DRAFT_295778 [Aspergillus carlsbadensis]|nr:hypothetical protein BJY00DRAFT_295778 [Aspergillus carlsbadensis]